MTALFERYPASPEAIRAAARSGKDSSTALGGLQHSLEVDHQHALYEAEGKVQDCLDAVRAQLATPSLLARAAVWASCQMERFADAIDNYNDGTGTPRGITALNAEWNGAQDGVDMTSAAVRTEVHEIRRRLLAEKGALERELDGCAERISADLRRGPTEEQIREAWAAGNLPPEAFRLWPDLDLKLTDLPAELTNTTFTPLTLDLMSDQALADALGDPNLNPQLRQLILDHHPEAVALFSEQWELSQDTETRSICTANSQGQIVGPDGRLYNVELPGSLPGPGERTDYDYIPDDGPSTWTTVTSRDGQVSYGDPIGLREQIAYVIGGVKNVGDQALGPDQAQYVTMDDGHVYLNDGTQPGADYTKPPDGKVNPYPGEHTYPEPYTGAAKVADVTGMVTGVLEGLTQAQQAEYNQQYATEVTFQEDASGDRRAVINIYQTQVTDDGGVQVDQMYGMVRDGGQIVPGVVGDDGLFHELEP